MSIELTKTFFPDKHNRRTKPGLTHKLDRWLPYLLLKLQIQKERRDLASLPPHLLQDIGIDAIDAHRESNRSFSDIPDSRALDNQ